MKNMSIQHRDDFRKTRKGFEFRNLSDEELQQHFAQITQRKKQLLHHSIEMSMDKQEKQQLLVTKAKQILNDIEELREKGIDIDSHLDEAFENLQSFYL